jgi:hypothetical protein
MWLAPDSEFLEGKHRHGRQKGVAFAIGARRAGVHGGARHRVRGCAKAHASVGDGDQPRTALALAYLAAARRAGQSLFSFSLLGAEREGKCPPVSLCSGRNRHEMIPGCCPRIIRVQRLGGPAELVRQYGVAAFAIAAS